jgi:hypothetical protein
VSTSARSAFRPALRAACLHVLAAALSDAVTVDGHAREHRVAVRVDAVAERESHAPSPLQHRLEIDLELPPTAGEAGPQRVQVDGHAVMPVTPDERHRSSSLLRQHPHERIIRRADFNRVSGAYEVASTDLARRGD